MSLFSRLFGKDAAKPVAEPAAPPPPSGPARPDPAVVAQAEEASVAEAIAAGDMTRVGQWVLEGSSTRVRQAAAQAITARAQLDQLIPAVRGKDKSVYRILTARRDAMAAAERATRQRDAELAETIAALARHSGQAWDPLYAATLARLETRWRAVAADATPAQQAEAAQLIGRSHDVVEAQRLALVAEAERRQAAALATEEARRERERAALVAAEAAAAQAERAEARRQAEAARREGEDGRVRELLGLLRQAQAALEQGGTARAVRLRDSIAQKLPDAPPLPAWFERKLLEVDSRLGELQDWRTFTVVPKRAELVQRMQGLVGADMSPEELAKQVRRLRDEWRTLHRGAGDEPTPEHEQFEAAARLAYEPCREHFARQAESRKQNQARREALLERLAAFAAEQSGESPDWRAVQYALVDARREWRDYAPVDQDAIKPLQVRFHALLDELQARLEAEYARNVQEKRALIARAAGLASLEDPRQAVDEARDLQQIWKSVGPVPRHGDEALWAEFRGHCDAVFARSSQVRASRDAALDDNQARAATVCEELERLGADEAADEAVLRRRLAELQSEFESLELPRASVRTLRRRLDAATEQAERMLQRRRVTAQRCARNMALAAHAQVRAYELAVARGADGDEREALRTAAMAALAPLDPVAKEARAVLERQVEAAGAGTLDFDARRNETALRLLCVRAELLAGLDSPSEDLELRREHQMQRLVASMGRGESDAAGAVATLLPEWLAVGPVEACMHDTLHARFVRALDAVGG